MTISIEQRIVLQRLNDWIISYYEKELNTNPQLEGAKSDGVKDSLECLAIIDHLLES